MNNPWNDINSPSKDISARRVDYRHPLDLFWAKDYLGHYLFIFEFPADDRLYKVTLPDLVGIQTIYIPAMSHAEQNRIVLILNDQADWEIFLSLCKDLIGATQIVENTSVAVQAVLNRLDRWQEFLKKNRSGILPEEKIIGLIGELLFIVDHLIPAFGPGQAVQFWQGPEGLPQDFSVNESAIEVKSRSAATSPCVKISSAYQLCTQLPEMYLFVVTLGRAALETKNSINVCQLVSQIRESLKSESSTHIARFNDLLYTVGYIESDRYLDFNYLITEQKMYRVSEGFPRICSKSLDPAVLNVSYSISLAACAGFEGRPNWMKIQK